MHISVDYCYYHDLLLWVYFVSLTKGGVLNTYLSFTFHINPMR